MVSLFRDADEFQRNLFFCAGRPELFFQHAVLCHRITAHRLDAALCQCICFQGYRCTALRQNQRGNIRGIGKGKITNHINIIRELDARSVCL